MIWQFDPTRRMALWILSLAALLGLGIEITEYWSARRVVGSSGVVSFGMDSALAARADSLWRSRMEQRNLPIDLNTGSASDFERLPGVGPAIAERMVEYRETHDGFKSVEELDSVPGIGAKKLDAMRARVKIEAK